MIVNGHFTLNFHYHELTLRVIIYLFTAVCLHTRDQRRLRKRSSEPWSAYLESAEKLWSFADTTSSEP